MRFFYVLILLICGLPGIAVGREPEPPLQTLKSCARLYSKPKEPATASALKAMDKTLSDHSAAIAKYSDVIRDWKAVCKILTSSPALFKNSPELAKSQKLYPMIGLLADRLDEFEKATKDFQPALQRINTVERNLACDGEIKKLGDEFAATRKRLDDEVETIKCSP